MEGGLFRNQTKKYVTKHYCLQCYTYVYAYVHLGMVMRLGGEGREKPPLPAMQYGGALEAPPSVSWAEPQMLSHFQCTIPAKNYS